MAGVLWVWAACLLERANAVGASGMDGGCAWKMGSHLFFVGVSAVVLFATLRACERRVAAAREEQQAVAARYRALLETSPDAIHVLDEEGRLVEANAAFYRSLGHDPERPPELSVRDWDGRWSEEELRRRVGMLMEKEAVFETTHRRRDGTVREVEVSAARVELEGRRMLMCVARDMGGRRHFQRTQLRLERLESLGLLAGGIAHDLNNALAPVILGTELLQVRHPGAGDGALLESMRAAAQRGAGMIRQLLTFARGVAGERVPVDISLLLAGVVRHAEEMCPAVVQVGLEIEGSGEGLPVIRGDLVQLGQVLSSLVCNARDAMPHGGRLTVGARARMVATEEADALPGAKPGSHLEFFVRDTGPGLTEEAREHLFEPFFTTKPRGQGTGLGLSTALGIARSHRGTIEHAVPAGGGTEFRVLVPAVNERSCQATETGGLAAERARNEAEKRKERMDTPDLRNWAGAGRLVLLVEDDGAVRTSARAVLERHGFRVLEAEDGLAGLAGLEEATAAGAAVAVVLTDLMMPRMPGDVMALRMHEARPGLPVVAMTGLHPDDPRAPDMACLLAKGVFAAVLAKPFDEERMLTALGRAMGRRQAAKPGDSTQAI